MKTLHRPMFRRGGSTGEGITSGLSRQGYETGKTVQPRRPNTNLNNFLIDFGLDLISRPPQGGIFATAASAAKDPFSRFQARQVAQEDRDWQKKMYDEKMAFEQEKFKEDKSQFKRELEQDRYLGELEAQGEKQFIEDQINAYWDPLIEAELDEEKKKLLENEKRADKYNIIVQGADISDQYKILTNEAAYTQALTAAENELENTKNDKTGINWVQEDAGYAERLQLLINKYLRLASKFLEEGKQLKASGGRVGKALGGEITEDINMRTQTPGGISDINISETMESNPGSTNEINISYEQLRDRLPPEISNDIVLLLSESYEAFADFAEIQTQADVNEFNTKYNVQLFLPQQTGV
jgi:hypothetical protein